MQIKMVPGNQKQRSAQGFTLIEVLIAMAIFAIGILAVASLQMRSISQNASAGMQTAATTLAVDWMERLLSLPYEDICLDEGDSGRIVSGQTYAESCKDEAARFLQTQAGNYTIQWTVAEDPNNKGLPIKQIDIQVTHANRNARTVNLSTIRGQGELPGP